MKKTWVRRSWRPHGLRLAGDQNPPCNRTRRQCCTGREQGPENDRDRSWSRGLARNEMLREITGLMAAGHDLLGGLLRVQPHRNTKTKGNSPQRRGKAGLRRQQHGRSSKGILTHTGQTWLTVRHKQAPAHASTRTQPCPTVTGMEKKECYPGNPSMPRRLAVQKHHRRHGLTAATAHPLQLIPARMMTKRMRKQRRAGAKSTRTNTDMMSRAGSAGLTAIAAEAYMMASVQGHMQD